MSDKKYDKLYKLGHRYRFFLAVAGLVILASIIGSLRIYYVIGDLHPHKEYWHQFAALLMGLGQTILGTVVIGGGLGGIFNFMLEEMKKEEEDSKNKIKEWQEQRQKNKAFRLEMLHKLQAVHDSVELARILIKSHRSGKTYGDQIRNHIMPSLISLQDFKRRLSNNKEDRSLVKNLPYLQVSLTYMAAYLSALIEEFAFNYLEIANLQGYQDAMASQLRTAFSVQSIDEKEISEQSTQMLNHDDIPDRIDAVWSAMEKLDYIWDFIDEIRDDKGKESRYHRVFLLHYFHCLRLLKRSDSTVNENLTKGKKHEAYLKELERIETKQSSDDPLTKRDSLTRKIMETELEFDFELRRKKEG